MFAVGASLSRHCCGLIGLDLPIVRTTDSNHDPHHDCRTGRARPTGRDAGAVRHLARVRQEAATADIEDAYAADAIKRIAGTLDQVGDEVLMRLATINEISNGTLSSLMSARLAEVGFALPTYPDAKGFFQPLVEQADAILHRARQRLN